LVVEVDGDGEALDAGLGAGQRHLLVRDDEGRVARGGGGEAEDDEEDGEGREGQHHGVFAFAWLGFDSRFARLGRYGIGMWISSQLPFSLVSGNAQAGEAARGPRLQDFPSVAREVRFSVWVSEAVAFWSGGIGEQIELGENCILLVLCVKFVYVFTPIGF
jgi:hypothetical protein